MQKHICLPFGSEAQYRTLVDDAMLYREFLNHSCRTHPELFPTAWAQGSLFTTLTSHRKPPFHPPRQTQSNRRGVSIRPSFLMPYQTARTDDVEKALYLLQFGVPFAALAYVFGRDEMFWYRLFLQLGRPSLVGTTIKRRSVCH